MTTKVAIDGLARISRAILELGGDVVFARETDTCVTLLLPLTTMAPQQVTARWRTARGWRSTGSVFQAAE